MPPVASLWRPFGLRANPFFQDELTPDPANDHPVTLLVERKQELHTLRAQIEGEPHSRVIVEGRAGVGKTSLVNRLKNDLQDQYLTHVTPVRIISTMSAQDFEAAALREVLRMRATLAADRPPTTKAKRLTSAPIRKADQFWERATTTLEGASATGWGVSGGIPALSAGVQRQKTHTPPDIPFGSLYALFQEAAKRLIEEADRHLLLHVNNLENLSDHDAKEAARLVRDVRDVLKVPGVHWIFVGTTGVERTVFRASDQVSGFFPAAVTLEPLDAAGVHAMLEKRYTHLRAGASKLTPPIDPAAIPPLYGLFRGDLRNFLRLLHDAATTSARFASGDPLTAADVRAAMQTRYAAKVEADVGTTAFGHLTRTVEDPAWSGEFRQADMIQRAGIKGPAAKRSIDVLREKRVIVPSRTAGRNAFFTLSGETAVALGL